MGPTAAEIIGATEISNFAMQVINAFMSRYTGMDIETIEEETDRDNFLGPQAAMDKGLIDRILER